GARALKQSLEAVGLEVDAPRNEAEANDKVLKEDYDAIILDLAPPPEEGLSLVKSWRQAGLTAHVLVLTPPGGFQDRVRSLDAGADDCLDKPVPFQEFLARVRALARRSSRVQGASVRVGDLEVNPASRTVRRSSQPIKVTPREFALLHYLIMHRGKVVTRAMIWEHLYDEIADYSSNVIDVHICCLRNKIDKEFDPPLILTRRREGYLLRGDDPRPEKRRTGGAAGNANRTLGSFSRSHESG
ncbi:MAG TPA: response regulator transcription factor, partial [Gemmataceae bacterium]|nr:response regulator transcription factor [Gemmataceae bacterium]